ncbi:MAG: HAMP domain-containing histidine kinase [Clostridia bacterium]|nr:HAMP domain-containing histidine kinase [Clostridia bacterium]
MVNYNREVLLKNRQLVTHMEDLVQARTRELHTVLEERKNFFSDMAHNLKAPIAAVHGFISLIREGNLYLDDELREYIRLIESENNEIRHRVQSLSALNAFDRITAPKAPVDVDELLSAVEERNAPDVGVMGVHFSVGRLGRAAVVCAQREKLLTLFENLIYNAIAFTPEGGSITVTPQAEGGTVRITVADSGSGIPPQHLPHIFERFYTTRSGEEGSGLGLYICALTVEELGGTITAESEPGKGAVFVLTLPTQGY